MIAEDPNTVTLDRDGLVERVSRDRVVLAAKSSNPTQSQPTSGNAHGSRLTCIDADELLTADPTT